MIHGHILYTAAEIVPSPKHGLLREFLMGVLYLTQHERKVLVDEQN